MRRNPKGTAFAGGLHRCSSLRWNNHMSLLAPCSPSRKVRFVAMRSYEIGSRKNMNSASLAVLLFVQPAQQCGLYFFARPAMYVGVVLQCDQGVPVT